MLKMGFDDYAVDDEPSQNVDYLSNEWKSEDIWETRRYIRRHERDYGRRMRLENALWRSWAKSNHRLSTVQATSLNWEKDSDVTWLYGPWKGQSQIRCPDFSPSPRNCKSPLWPVPRASAFKARISKGLPSRPLHSSTWPPRRRQYADTYTAGPCQQQQLAKKYHAVRAFPWALKLKAALRGMMNLFRKLANRFPPSRNHRNRVRFNEEVRQCVVKETSLATEPCSDTDRTAPLMGEFHSMACATAKVLVFHTTIAPLPSTTLKPSMEITRMTWSAATDYLAEL